MTRMGTTAQGFDPAALLVILLIVGAGAALGIAAFRRRPKVPSWLKVRRSSRRLDVIRRDLDRMTEHTGELPNSEPAVHQPFDLGLAEMAACHWDKAVGHFHEAWARASRSQLVPLTVQIGVCHYMQGSLFDALKEFRGTIDLAEREGDKQGRAAALANIGVIHHEYGELGSALTLLNEALTIGRESGDQRSVALCLGNMGNIQRDRGQLEDALKSHEDALAISRGIGDDRGVVSALGNSASVRRDRGELDKALELYAEAVETARKIGDNFGYAAELGGIGGVYRDKGDLDRALKFHEDALAGARRIGYRLGEAAELGNVGLILEKRGAHAQAVANLVETLTILMLVGVNHGQNQALLGLSRCDDALGRERMSELLKQAGVSDEGSADLMDRVDQLRLRRPRPRIRS
jgi:tetratricopeptide (TPR) repeat protein